jgi:hypothetical protein
MRPLDKYGRPIYSRTFEKLQRCASVLEMNGYRESIQKPNLFYKKTAEGVFFADMRGTEIIPIWDSPVPIFYARLEGPAWKQRRLWKQELELLHKEGCPVRLSFELGQNGIFSELSMEIDEENAKFDWPVGLCYECGKDFQDEGEYCDPICAETARVKTLNVCVACNNSIEWPDLVEHHTSYFPERTVYVHRSCHTLIHKTQTYLSLKPSEEESKKFYDMKRRGVQQG